MGRERLGDDWRGPDRPDTASLLFEQHHSINVQHRSIKEIVRTNAALLDGMEIHQPRRGSLQ
jgi:hypothetical protein